MGELLADLRAPWDSEHSHTSFRLPHRNALALGWERPPRNLIASAGMNAS